MIPSQLVSGLANDDFARVLGACPRRARETLFTRFGIPKAKKTASALLPAKDPARIRKLQGAMTQIKPDDEEGQQLAEELIRVYLMTRRGLLGDALDAIGITHDDGLTDEDLDASSGIRFHPGEMLVSFGFKLGAIAILGPAALAVFLFEVLLNVVVHELFRV